MNPVLQIILTNGFLITEEAAIGFLPVVAALLKNDKIDTELWAERRKANLPQVYNQKINTVYPYSFTDNQVPADSVGIINVVGEITKYSQFCGPRGMDALVRDIKQLNENPNIIAGLLRIDSPGGQASFTDVAADAIRKSEKPIIGFVTGMAASAAYWIVSATKKIFVESKNDELGSIGTMIMFWDLQEYWKNEGIKLQTVYATLSTEKNKDFHELMAGKFDNYRKTKLDPLNEDFHDNIRENRKGKIDPTDKEIFSGKLFNASQALTKGLFDAFGSFEDALKEAHQMGIDHKNNYVKQSKTIVYV